jgi:acyl carrier protein
MDEVRGRLMRCFRAALPQYSSEIERLRPAEAAGWDSLATVTLLTLIQEEFNIQIPAEDLECFSSFTAAERYVTNRASAS